MLPHVYPKLQLVYYYSKYRHDETIAFIREEILADKVKGRTYREVILIQNP